MLKSEGLTSLDNCCETAVLAGSNYLAWLELYWGTTMRTLDFLSDSSHAFKPSVFLV
jgi:hypothetical protein